MISNAPTFCESPFSRVGSFVVPKVFPLCYGFSYECSQNAGPICKKEKKKKKRRQTVNRINELKRYRKQWLAFEMHSACIEFCFPTECRLVFTSLSIDNCLAVSQVLAGIQSMYAHFKLNSVNSMDFNTTNRISIYTIWIVYFNTHWWNMIDCG